MTSHQHLTARARLRVELDTALRSLGGDSGDHIVILTPAGRVVAGLVRPSKGEYIRVSDGNHRGYGFLHDGDTLIRRDDAMITEEFIASVDDAIRSAVLAAGWVPTQDVLDRNDVAFAHVAPGSWDQQWNRRRGRNLALYVPREDAS